MDPGRLLADYVAKQGEGGQSAGVFGHTLIHLVQEVLRDRERQGIFKTKTVEKRWLFSFYSMKLLYCT